MKKSLITHRKVLPGLLAAAFACGASAQEAKLEEVIITAQKRAEKLQDVPISVSAISGAQLELRGIEGSRDLSSLAPSLMVTYGNSGNSTMSIISIRGSASGAPSIFLDTAVGTYVDGIYVGKNQGGLFEVVDLERVEVLRGPQGTLFGRNTLAGAINMITRKPSGNFSGAVSLDVGNHGAHTEKISLDLPRTGPLALNISARNEYRDGYVHNDNAGAAGKMDKQAYRVAAALDLSPQLKVNYSFDHSDINNVPLPVSLYTAYGWQGSLATTTNSSALGFGSRATLIANASQDFPTSRNTTPGFPEWEKMKSDNHAVIVDYAISNSDAVKYIYASRKMRWSDSLDLDGSVANAYAYMRDTRLNTESHELQWVGNWNKLKYVAGYYAYKEDNRTYNPQVINTALGNMYVAPDFSGSVNADAIFGQLDYEFSSQWSGSIGVRRSTDKKGVDASQYGTGSSFSGDPTAAGLSALIFAPGPIPVTTVAGDALAVMANGAIVDFSKQPTGVGTVGYPAVFHAAANAKFSATTPAASLTYKLNEGVNIYGRIAKGFRSGGFPAEAGGSSVAQVTASKTTPFFPEKSTTEELGFKSTFWGGKAQVNGAIYQNKIKDLQTQRMVPGTTSSITVNAGRVTVKGFELEGQVAFADGWRAGASWGHVDAKIDSWMDNSVATNTSVPAGTYIETAGDRVMSYAPKNTFNLNLDGRLAKTAWGTLRGNLDISHVDKMYNVPAIKDLTAPDAGGTYLASLCEVPARTLVNGRLTLAGLPVGGPGRADISLWVRNMADVRKPVNYIDMGYFRVATWTEPRMYGLSASYKW